MFNRINQYRSMWIITAFDLPTQTNGEKLAYTRFSKFLKQDGFERIQYSIYARHCSSKENIETHANRIRSAMPKKGSIVVFPLTDKQFGLMEFFSKGARLSPDELPIKESPTHWMF